MSAWKRVCVYLSQSAAPASDRHACGNERSFYGDAKFRCSNRIVSDAFSISDINNYSAGDFFRPPNRRSELWQYSPYRQNHFHLLYQSDRSGLPDERGWQRTPATDKYRCDILLCTYLSRWRYSLFCIETSRHI